MPRIDPQQLLKTLGILLSPSGGIKSSEEVDRLVKLMSKFSRKLVSKCIYVQILKATPAELLSKFLAEGGWQLLNTWFDDAIKAHNWPLVREMLHLFHFCPMTAELLKENASEHQAPKLINQLRQEASIQADIRGLALDIYKSWVAVVSSPLVKTVENSSNHQLPDPAAENSDDSATNGRAPDEASGPVSLLQSLADEVSESIKKEKEVVDDEIESEEDSDEEDPDILAMKNRLALKNRKGPIVIKPGRIVDATIKINKKNLPTPEKKSSKKSSSVSEEITSKPEKRRRSSEAGSDSLSKSPSAKVSKRSGSKFRRDGIRDEVGEDEKQRIKEMARKMKEEQAAKLQVKPGGITSTLGKIPRIPKKTPSTSSLSSPGPEGLNKTKSFEEMLGVLDTKPSTVKTPMVKNKTAALLEGMQKSSSTSSLPSSKSSSSKSSSSKSSSSSSHKKDHHSHSSSSKSSSKDHHRDRDRDGHHSSSSSRRDSTTSSSSKSDSKREKSALSLTMPTSPHHSSSSKSKSKNSESDSPKVSSKSPIAAYSESSSFMDSIFSSMGVPSRKKKRRNSESKGDESSKNNGASAAGKPSATPPKVAKKDPESPTPDSAEPKKEEPVQPTFSFYQDTQVEAKAEVKEETSESELNPKELKDESNGDGDNKIPKAEEGSESKPINAENGNNSHDPDNNETEVQSNGSGNEAADALPFEEPESMPREVKGILVYHRGRGKRDKKITWRPESQLVEVEYFEVDENERVNVNKLKFENLREMESKLEKAAMNSKTNMSDEETPLLAWYKMRPIKVTNREPFTPGEKSKEKETQSQREKNVLQVIYFSRAMTPDTPSEADTERDTAVVKNSEPCLIPLEDKEADDQSDFQYGSKGWPEPKQNEVSKQASFEASFSLPPALSNLLSSLNKEGLGGWSPSPAIQKSLNSEEQMTLAAQLEAVKTLGILPGTAAPPVAIPTVNEPPPGIAVPPPGFQGERLPPPGVPPFGAPPPFGGPPPRQNGYPGPNQGPPPSFGGFQNNRNGGPRGGPGGNYHQGQGQGGYKTGGGHGPDRGHNQQRGGGPNQQRGGGPNQRGGHYNNQRYVVYPFFKF